MNKYYNWMLLPLLALMLGLGVAACDDADDDDSAADDDDTTGDDDDTTGDDDDTTGDDDDSATTGDDDDSATTGDDDDSATAGDDDDSAVVASFTFSTTAWPAYTRVDRIGMPAVNTALIDSANKDAYNAGDPAGDADAANPFVADIVATINALHSGVDASDNNTGLDDDLAGLGLTPCTVDGAGGGTCVAQGAPLVLPDTLQIDPAAAAGFPNGRMLADPVIDATLAVLLLDLTTPTHAVDSLVGALNPTANDVAFLTEFPYLAAAH